jgi:hypothetical protein
VRQPVSSLEPDVQIGATPHPDPAQRHMNEVCVNISVKPGTPEQQASWSRLWRLLLAEPPEETSAPVTGQGTDHPGAHSSGARRDRSRHMASQRRRDDA